MVKFTLAFFAVAAVAAAAITIPDQPKSVVSPKSLVKMAIYYDADRANQRLIFGKLQELFCKVEQYIQLTLVPFGKTIRDRNGEYACLHGPEECERLVIHNCVLSRIPYSDILTQIDYINCDLLMPDNSRTMHDAYSCASSVAGLKVEEIKNCVHSEEGMDLMLNAEDITANATEGHTLIPTLMFDGHYDSTINLKATQDLELVLCLKLLFSGYKNVCRRGKIYESVIC